MPALRPIAYVDRATGATLCRDCTTVRHPHLSHLHDPTERAERIGEIYAHDLDPDDACPCDHCGACCCSPDSL
jgi:hypothetical protein